MIKHSSILDKGHVALVDMYGSELSIVNFARASFARHSEELKSGDRHLIRFLVLHRHGSPLEAVDFTFQLKIPIFVCRELQRHRISSFNEMSLRYVKAQPDFYEPEARAIRTQHGKPGAYHFEPVNDSNIEESVQACIRLAYADAMTRYQNLLKMGVAKELARVVLPVGIYTELYWKLNLRSLLNFLMLRNADNALYEIRELARAVEGMIVDIVPNVHAAFEENGRVAP